MSGTVPEWLLRHTVTVERYAGDTAYGKTYDPPEELAALVAETVRNVRNAEGRQTVSTAQVIASHTLDCPPESRITLPGGRVTRVLSVAHHTAPGLPVPQSTEVMCE